MGGRGATASGSGQGSVTSTAQIVVNSSGMRQESFAIVAAQRASGAPMRPIEVSVYHGERPVLVDGRHRLDVARARGDTHIEARVRVYGKRGALLSTTTRRIAIDR